VASCGNDGNGNSSKLIDKIPASSPGAISIAACDQSDNVLELSTKSNTISLTAPGDGLRSAGLDFSIPTPFGETSAATAYVAGIAALMTSAAKGRKSKKEILDSLLNNVKVTAGQKKDRYGKGIVDPFAAMKNLLP
jgi:subtilisin family serine protease